MWPGAYTFINGHRIRVWKAKISDLNMGDAIPGQIVKIDPEGIYVSTNEGCLLLKEVQMEGKKRMDANQFVQGHRLKIGEIFLKF
jgi:methionyl-tRNA formyltransferase